MRRSLHDDPVLIAGRIDRRDDPFAERIVQRIVDLPGGHAEPRGGRAIDRQPGFEPALLLIGIDVGQLRHLLQRGRNARPPLVELMQIVGLQRVLVLRERLPPADADILHRLQKQPRAGDLRELGPQAGDDLGGRNVALGQRFQCDKDKPGIRPPAAGKAGDAGDRRILAENADEPGQLVAHQLERGALIGPDPADETPGILLRKQPLRDHDEEIDIERDDQRQRAQNKRRPAQRPRQGARIKPQHRGEYAVACGTAIRAGGRPGRSVAE